MTAWKDRNDKPVEATNEQGTDTKEVATAPAAPKKRGRPTKASKEAEIKAVGTAAETPALKTNGREKPPFDIPPEWDPNTPDANLPPDILRVKEGSYLEPPGMKLEHYWSSKDPAYIQTALDAGLRFAQRAPGADLPWQRPNVDPGSIGTTAIEKHDCVLMVAPPHVFERERNKARDQSDGKRRSNRGLYEAAISNLEAIPIIDMPEPGPVFPRKKAT